MIWKFVAYKLGNKFDKKANKLAWFCTFVVYL